MEHYYQMSDRCTADVKCHSQKAKTTSQQQLQGSSGGYSPPLLFNLLPITSYTYSAQILTQSAMATIILLTTLYLIGQVCPACFPARLEVVFTVYFQCRCVCAVTSKLEELLITAAVGIVNTDSLDGTTQKHDRMMIESLIFA